MYKLGIEHGHGDIPADEPVEPPPEARQRGGLWLVPAALVAFAARQWVREHPAAILTGAAALVLGAATWLAAPGDGGVESHPGPTASTTRHPSPPPTPPRTPTEDGQSSASRSAGTDGEPAEAPAPPSSAATVEDPVPTRPPGTTKPPLEVPGDGDEGDIGVSRTPTPTCIQAGVDLRLTRVQLRLLCERAA